jgi:cytochrome c oxidase subunit 2
MRSARVEEEIRVAHRSGRRHAARPGALRKRLTLVGSAALVLATTTGCTVNEVLFLDLPEPATEEADVIQGLWNGSWTALWPVGVLVWGLMIFSFIAYSRKRRPEVPVQTTYNLPIETLYTVAPLIMIVGMFWFTARDQTEILTVTGDEKNTINVVAFRWAWAFNYVQEDVYEVGTPFNYENPDGTRPTNQDSATTLWLPVNEKVRFELTSSDVVHSFWVPHWLFKLDVIPGKLNQFEVTPNRTGQFNGKCAELCGVDHSRMLFNVKVVSQAEFDAHIAELRAKGQTGQLETGRVNLSGEPNVDGRTL